MSEFDLERFVAAQAPIYDSVVAELTAGRKRSHWMWFIFPQISGLGASPTARTYAIRSLDEARAYLRHQLLGERLRHCTTLVLRCGERDPHAIFGSPDDLKFRSSMTLFAAASEEADPFAAAINHFFAGQGDPLTRQRLDEMDKQQRPGA